MSTKRGSLLSDEESSALQTTRRAVTFESDLGWFALLACDQGICRLSFMHATPLDALRAVDGENGEILERRNSLQVIVQRLQAYAHGKLDDFRDVPLALDQQTNFQRRVREACRQIVPGQTLSYGELAVKVGAPQAARAVGNCMARNPVPIIVPCHRVLASGGRLGGYSMGSGLDVKRRLLRLEGVSLP